MLVAQNLQFCYQQPVVDEVSLTLAKGELLAVVGPNGAGKSTLVRLLGGLLKPAQGKVLLNQVELSTLSYRQRAHLLGYVAQENPVQFPITALEFVLQGRFAYGQGIGFEQAGDLHIAQENMQLTQTAHFAHRQLNALSGGERQRIFLARALTQQPQFLLLDEPTSNLDLAHQVTTLTLLKKFTQTHTLGVLLITHELNLAAEFADTVLLLKAGKMVKYGKPAEVFEQKTLEEVFETALLVDQNPESGAPRVTIKLSHHYH